MRMDDGEDTGFKSRRGTPSTRTSALPCSDPQTWNMYAYTRNNPTTLTDPSGLEPDPDVHFQDEHLEQQAATIGAQSPTFKTEVDNARNDPNVHVEVVEKGVQRLSEGAPAETSASEDKNGIHITITVDPYDDPNAEHEWGHEKDVRTNTKQFFQDASRTQRTQGGPNQVPHDQRPEERRADTFKNQVEKERKAYGQQHKHKKRKNGFTLNSFINVSDKENTH